VVDPQQPDAVTLMLGTALHDAIGKHPLPWLFREQDGIGFVEDANGNTVTSCFPPELATSVVLAANDLRAGLAQDKRLALGEEEADPNAS
jgi:hypothetical protein